MKLPPHSGITYAIIYTQFCLWSQIDPPDHALYGRTTERKIGAGMVLKLTKADGSVVTTSKPSAGLKMNLPAPGTSNPSSSKKDAAHSSVQPQKTGFLGLPPPKNEAAPGGGMQLPPPSSGLGLPAPRSAGSQVEEAPAVVKQAVKVTSFVPADDDESDDDDDDDDGATLFFLNTLFRPY